MRARQTESAAYRAAVRAYVAAGADEQVQRVVTAVHRLSKRLEKWYDAQLADLNVSANEWAVLSELARVRGDEALTPSQLAQATDVAASSMTHRLDRLVARDLVVRDVDPDNRTRVLVRLTDAGWQLYADVIQSSNLVEADLIASLSPEQTDALASLLETVIEGLDESDG
ncbi:DNA-binding MarR family transcriptional regulator [Friedmanniella endophytica]|uniref:DNA-binding MarR family transcriptional regulator n=1 Tax=Microlunatus kandeliicorticis TaxID=1759536 RepID=A0A7W3ISY3_9ACTN|nr:MarR family transcriptional regulator [Microlunatus kandeliicorticis]MBA8794679.1 DNA-binding MarR family transcriptional regulator [Microlunatus kandeliicorticis]